MAFYQFLCASTVMIILLSGGCHSQQPVCGRAPRNRIEGGRDDSPGNWPWLVFLNRDRHFFCSGSLISNEWVMTSAPCVTGNSRFLTTVYLGPLTLSGPNINTSREVERSVCHPPSDRFIGSSICLLKLSAPVNFTDYIQPVCLASAGSTFHTGVSGYAVGFGSFHGGIPPQVLKVLIVGNNECKCTYPEIPDDTMCARVTGRGEDSCQGNSGVPLVIKIGSMWIQSGIGSFGNTCRTFRSPGGYLPVSIFQEWITNITDSSEPGFVTSRSSGVDSDSTFTCSNIQPTNAIITTTTNSSIPTNTTTFKWPTEEPKYMESYFDSGANVVHFSHFTSLCLLVISLYALV